MLANGSLEITGTFIVGFPLVWPFKVRIIVARVFVIRNFKFAALGAMIRAIM